MVGEFFLGFAGHAHTRNDLEADPNKAMQLRRENSIEEARKLTEAVLDKLERDISDAGHDLTDVKLLTLYLSYRGETEEKDRLISENILEAIEKRFKGKTPADQLRLIGHTTAGEIENEDLEPKGILRNWVQRFVSFGFGHESPDWCRTSLGRWNRKGSCGARKRDGS